MHGTTGRARGQPVQIGVLLIFAFLIIGLALFQAVLVPQENSQVEFNHNQDLQSDMVDLRSDLLRTAATGEARTTQVRLGTTYPSRTLLLNPAPPSGTLRSAYRGNLSITNARATSSTGVEDFWDGDTTDDPTWTDAGGDPVPSRHTFRTNALLYEPSYNSYDGAPETVFEGSVLYNRFPEESLALSNQTFINGRSISLTAVQGEYGQSMSRAATVDPRVVSAVNRTVTVTDSDGPVTLRVPTRLSLSQWETLLSGEMGSGNDQHVADLAIEEGPSGPNDVLVVTLEEGVSYDLELGAVAVGSRGPTEGAEQAPQYLVVAGGNGDSIDEGDIQRLGVEVRDRYNNPVSGATVTVQQPTVGYLVGSGGDPMTLTTDEHGRAAVTYAAPRNVRRNQAASFTASIPGGGDARTVDLGVTVEDDSEADVNGEYGRPLISAIEPDTTDADSADEPFVRVYFPRDSGSDYVLDAAGGGTADVPDDPQGTYYLVGGDGSLDGPCSGASGTTVDLGTISLDGTAGTLDLRNTDTGRVRDSLTYDGDPSNDGGGGPVTFTDSVGVRVTEDGAYVDSNVSAVDWTSDRASEVCDVDQPPTVGALSASSNYASSNGGNVFTDRVTFTYNASTDRGSPTVTVEADPSGDQTPSESTTTTNPAGSVTLVFDSNVQMSGNTDGSIDVTVTVSDGSAATSDRVCEGTLDDAGETLTRTELSCNVQ